MRQFGKKHWLRRYDWDAEEPVEHIAARTAQMIPKLHDTLKAPEVVLVGPRHLRYRRAKHSLARLEGPWRSPEDAVAAASRSQSLASFH
jgi:hypothetical protein